MRATNVIIVLCAALLIAGGCTRSEKEIVGPPFETALLTNGTFESDGGPSLDGWQANKADTGYVAFSTDVPPGGGAFSVRLTNEWSFPGSLRQPVVVPSGTHRYRLTASGKAVHSGLVAGGWMRILVKQEGVWIETKSFQFSDSVWTTASLLDTLTSGLGGAGDSIAVSLSGNFDQWSNGFVLFDLVEFERLD